MSNPFVIFWTVMVFTSIAWYAFLLLYIGVKGGKEIKEMTKALAARPEEEKKS